MKRAMLVVPVLACLSAGCALLTRGKALEVAYYDPLPPRPASVGQAPAACEVALGRVRAAEALRTEIEYRSSPDRVGFYDARRWTESPDRYLALAIDRALFQSGRCRQTLSTGGPTLDATLLAFEEDRASGAGRVAVHVLLHDGATVLWDATIESTRAAGSVDAGGAGFDGVVRALGAALTDAAARIANRVPPALTPR